MSTDCPERAALARRPKRRAARVAALACIGWCAVAGAAAGAPAVPAPVPLPDRLRVCLDPDQLPYSRADGQGFEVEVARLLADELRLPFEPVWQPMRRGLVRKTLAAHACDLLMAVPEHLDRVATTRPWYRSSWVLLTRRDDPAPLAGFGDARLRELRLGVPLVGDAGAASPPGEVLAARGVVRRVTGITADGGEGPVGQRLATAVARGELDAAFAWGPQAGWFAHHGPVPLRLQVVAAPPDARSPFTFALSVAVRPGETAWRDRLQAALDARRADIHAVLARWNVPEVEAPGDASGDAPAVSDATGGSPEVPRAR